MMFLAIAVLLVCFTAIVIYRMSIDRLKVELQHKRLSASDQFDRDRYVTITKTEPAKPEMPQFSSTHTANQVNKELQKRQALKYLEQVRGLPPASANQKLQDMSQYYEEAYMEELYGIDRYTRYDGPRSTAR